jgi:hypothetical protein
MTGDYAAAAGSGGIAPRVPALSHQPRASTRPSPGDGFLTGVAAGIDDQEHSRRRVASGENRLPPAAAVVVAVVIYALLPSALLFTTRLLIPVVEALLLLALIATNPRRMTRQTRWSRWTSAILAAVVILTNLVSLVLLVASLSSDAKGTSLLIGAMQVWATNVIGFALLYWEMDRGGPVARRELARERFAAADWRFSQDENHDNVSEVRRTSSKVAGWVPIFVDYLYLSLTNSSAFSPTDTMPLSTRAKVLMGIQATAALATSLLVIARAVGSLSS